jgi:hypothetical protein
MPAMARLRVPHSRPASQGRRGGGQVHALVGGQAAVEGTRPALRRSTSATDRCRAPLRTVRPPTRGAGSFEAMHAAQRVFAPRRCQAAVETVPSRASSSGNAAPSSKRSPQASIGPANAVRSSSERCERSVAGERPGTGAGTATFDRAPARAANQGEGERTGIRRPEVRPRRAEVAQAKRTALSRISERANYTGPKRTGSLEATRRMPLTSKLSACPAKTIGNAQLRGHASGQVPNDSRAMTSPSGVGCRSGIGFASIATEGVREEP